jgi:ribosomal protein S4
MHKKKVKICERLRVNLWAKPQLHHSPKAKWKDLQKQSFEAASPLTAHRLARLQPKKYLYVNRRRTRQRLRLYYGGLTEKRFRTDYRSARPNAHSLHPFLSLLERRLDVCLYRLHFAATPFAASQGIAHGAFRVNGQKVSLKNQPLRPGDLIEVAPKAFPRLQKATRERIQAAARKELFLGPVPNHLEVHYGLMKAIYLFPAQVEGLRFPGKALELSHLQEWYA